MPVPPTPHAHFDFDLAGAIVEQLATKFGGMPIGDLTTAALAGVEDHHGVYQLFHDGSLAYIGKADESLRKRLTDHLTKLSGRLNIDLNKLGFKCLYLPRAWEPVASEKALIGHLAGKCPWNKTAFGNNDPGRARETTGKGPKGFDSQYPINEDWPCDFEPRAWNARELLMAFKATLPYLLRYQTDNPKKWRDGSARYNALTVNLVKRNWTARELLAEVARQFPAGWQATTFSSHMILYKERRRYRHGVKVFP